MTLKYVITNMPINKHKNHIFYQNPILEYFVKACFLCLFIAIFVSMYLPQMTLKQLIISLSVIHTSKIQIQMSWLYGRFFR